MLTELIDAAGGWQAAVVIGQGLVNTAAKLDYWPVEEQNNILKTMKEFLENKLGRCGGSGVGGSGVRPGRG